MLAFITACCTFVVVTGVLIAFVPPWGRVVDLTFATLWVVGGLAAMWQGYKEGRRRMEPPA